MGRSKRASILARVLEHINNGDWEDRGDFLVFGKEAFEWSTERLAGDPEYLEDAPHLELLARVKVARGNRTIAQRISLQPISDDPSEAELERSISDSLSKFSREDLENLIKAVATTSKLSSSRGKDDTEADALDAALALAAVRGLDIAFERMSALDAMGIERGSVRNAEYFEEAHKCNLAGLNIASAVLCRAMLEAALQQVVDPQGSIDSRKAPGASYIDLMLDAAKHLLDGERRKAAGRIKSAGNNAIHDLSKFRERNAKWMPETLDDLRKVMADLYGEYEA